MRKLEMFELIESHLMFLNIFVGCVPFGVNKDGFDILSVVIEVHLD
jgi:hypothetical protein